MENQVLAVLNGCKINGNIVMLPEGHLDRKIYAEVNKLLTGIGGAWKGGKVMGFVFQSDQSERLAQIQGGDKVNLKKGYQFFATPTELADYIVSIAQIKDSDSVLEPSAGQGAIVEAIYRANKECSIDAIELMPENFKILQSKQDSTESLSWEGDFLELEKKLRLSNAFEKIIANPPFSKNQDIDHVQAMYRCLKSGGRLVSIMSTHWQRSDNEKEKDFRDWIEEIGGFIKTVPAGTFKESGTNVETVIVVIDKP